MPVTITPSPGTAALWGAMSRYPPTFEIIAISLSALALPFSAAFVTQLIDLQAMPTYLDASPSTPNNPAQVLYPGPATSKFKAQHIAQSLLPIPLTLLTALISFYAYSRRSLHPAITLHNSLVLSGLALLATITTGHNATKHPGPTDENLGPALGFTAGPGIMATLCMIGVCCNYLAYAIVSSVSWYRYRRYRKESGNFNSAYASEYQPSASVHDASIRENNHAAPTSEWAGSWRAPSASIHFDDRCTECVSRSTRHVKTPSRPELHSAKPSVAHSRFASQSSNKRVKPPSWLGADSARFMKTPSWLGSESAKQAKTPSWFGSASTNSHPTSTQRETFLSSSVGGKSPAMSSRTGRSNLTSIGSDVMTGTALTAIPAVPSLSTLKPPASAKTSHEGPERRLEPVSERGAGRASAVSALTEAADARLSRSAVSAITMPTVAEDARREEKIPGLNITLVKTGSEGKKGEKRSPKK